MALLAMVLCMPVMAQSKKETEQKIEEIKNQMELLKAQRQLDSLKAAMAQEAEGYKNDLERAKGNLPCMRDAFDDDEYFRGLGIGEPEEGISESAARRAALLDAKANIRRKMSEFVKGVATDYTSLYGGNKGHQLQSKIEDGFNTVIEGLLNDAKQMCEKMVYTDRGTPKSYIAIEISKKVMKKEVTDELKGDLGTDFKADQFQKFMDERMEEMIESKENAGY